MFVFVPGADDDLLKKLHLAGPLVCLCVASEKGYASGMSSFDYAASAELFATEGRSGLRYRRFAYAAEAIGYAIEKLPAKVLAGSSLRTTLRRSARSMNARAIRGALRELNL